MKRAVFIVFIIIFLAATSYAESLSTTKCIRLYVRVVSNPESESSSETAFIESFNEDTKSIENPAVSNNKSPNHKSSLFSEIGNSIRNLFLSLADPQGDMQRKY